MAFTSPGMFPDGVTTDMGASLVNEVWSRDIRRSVIEKMKFASTISQQDRPFNLLHIRKLGEPGTQNLPDTDTGDALTSSEIADTAVTMTPVSHYIYIPISRSQMAQMDVDPKGPVRSQVDAALARKVDTTCLQDVAGLVTHTFGSSAGNLDKPLLLSTIAALRNSSAAVEPGDDLRLLYGPLQFDDLMSIDAITNANIRGDSENPLVKGFTVKTLGLNIDVTGNLYTSGADLHNVVYVKEAFGIGYNERVSVMAQEYQLSHRIIAYVNFGHGIVWDERAASVVTKAT